MLLQDQLFRPASDSGFAERKPGQRIVESDDTIPHPH